MFAIVLTMNSGIDWWVSFVYLSFFIAFKGKIHEEKSIAYDYLDVT